MVDDIMPVCQYRRPGRQLTSEQTIRSHPAKAMRDFMHCTCVLPASKAAHCFNEARTRLPIIDALTNFQL